MIRLFTKLLTFMVIKTAIADEPFGSSYLQLMLNKIQQERLDVSDGDNYINEDYNMFDDEKHQMMDTKNKTILLFPDEELQNENHAQQDVPVEDLIKIIFTKHKQEFNGVGKHPENVASGSSNNDAGGKPDDQNGGTPLGYYYYFYPLDSLKNMNLDDENQMPPEISTMLKTMKNTKMKNTPKTPVGPLFASMLWFVGTAMVFIVTILLMPRVRIVKVKKSFSESRELSIGRLDETISKILSNLQ